MVVGTEFLPAAVVTPFNIMYFAGFQTVGLVLNMLINYARELYLRRGFVLTHLSHEESRKGELLLYQMLPPSVGDELRAKVRSRAKVFSDVTILYSDIKNFTKYSAASSPDRVVRLLSTLFSIFDLLTGKHTVYKIQTIGDAYVLVAGLPFCTNEEEDARSEEERKASAAWRCMDMGVDMLKAVAQVRTEEGHAIQMRLGIHTGKLTAGVIGEKKLRYDIWGNDPLIANKLESYSTPQCILFSEATRDFLEKAPQKVQQGLTTFDAFKPGSDYNEDGVNLKTYLYGPIGQDESGEEDSKGADLQALSEQLGVERKQVSEKAKNEETTRMVYAGTNKQHNSKKFMSNKVTNTKYTWYNFIFKNLNEQFKLTMNKYFLAIAVLQLIDEITPVKPETTWLPLIAIFCFTAIKELFDDRRRAKADKKANETPVHIVRDGSVIDVFSQDIVVGDIVFLKENETIPSDLVILKSSYAEGHCFLQTTNLDGETNFKNRIAHPATHVWADDKVMNFSGAVECATPNANLYEFDSRFWLTLGSDMDFTKPPTTETFALSGTSFLQQGARLVNTDWIYGVAVYTGNETKFGKNKEIPPTKLTKLDRHTDSLAWNIFKFQFILVIIFGALGIGFYEKTPQDAPWINGAFFESKKEGQSDRKFNFDIASLIIFWARFLLLNSTFIPISLKLTLDICKLYYAFRINNDLDLYDAPSNKRAKANSTAISEDLGQVEYVLTDKTGTLTQNDMVFKKLAMEYAHFDLENLNELQ
jgi:magnesium-transporting ATPase (P-type)